MAILVLPAGIVSLVLMYFIGARVFTSARYGVFAAAVFAVTPLLWQQSRSAPASLYPLLFVLGWLWAVSRFESGRSRWWALCAGGLLGGGVYTSHAAAVMMPLYLLVTIVVALVSRSMSFRELGLVVVAFAVVASPLALSLVLHPDVFRATVNGMRLYDADRFNVLQGVHEMMSWVGLTARSEVYYDYFNPALLFLGGRVLLWPLAVPVVAGLYQILANESALFAWLSFIGFWSAPFAASLTAEAPTPRRLLFITPFAALVAAFGVRPLLRVITTLSTSAQNRGVRLPDGAIDDLCDSPSHRTEELR